MLHQEKKYRVDSFAGIENILQKVGAKRKKEKISTHYYAQGNCVPRNAVMKVVQSSEKVEVHILKESGGRFSLKKNIPVKDLRAGLEWLKQKGCKRVGVIQMAHTDYAYKNGVVGLYLIDNFLCSVILDFSEKESASVEKELGLDTAEVIALPYNMYLEQIGQLNVSEVG